MKIKSNLNYYILMLGLIFIGILLVDCVYNPCFVEAAPGNWIDKSKGLSGKHASSVVINPANNQILYVAMYEKGVFKTTNSAQTWYAINNGLNTPESKQIISLTICSSNPEILYVGTNKAEIYKSIDGGKSWILSNQGIKPGTVFYTQIFSINIDPTNSSIIYAATSTGIYKSTNGGNSWNGVGSKKTGLNNSFNKCIAIDYKNPVVLYAASQKGVFKSTNQGKSWFAIGPEGEYVHYITIHPLDHKTIFIGTSKGLFKSSNAGKNWINTGLKSKTSGIFPSVKSIVINPSTPQVIYVGSNLGIFKSTDGGETWKVMKPEKMILLWSSNALTIDFTGPVIIYSAANGFKGKPGGFVWSWTN
jgi:photosystem II stability/assembly factor-like uncharacterized protein